MEHSNTEQPVALITGASGGIGEAIAHKMDADGFFVVVSGTNQQKLDKLTRSLGHARAVVCNLGSRTERAQLIDKTLALSEGRLDVMVANAGITADNLFMRMDNDTWDKVLDVNLTANFELCRQAIKVMMKQRYGRVVLMSSVTAHGGSAGQANYTASKAGLEAMAKTLAKEVATRGITVNTIAPGFISTPMTDVLSDKVKEQILTQIPQKRIGVPEDIAHAVAFLTSKDAGYITGETLHVNGGMLMP